MPDWCKPRLRSLLIFLFAVVALGSLAAQSPGPPRRIEFGTIPADARVRPFESVIVRVRVLGAEGLLGDAPSRTTLLPLRRSPTTFGLRDERAGWLSKPFRFQGVDVPAPGERVEAGLEDRLHSMTGQRSEHQDVVLFTASDAAREAIITASVEGAFATTRIRIDDKARSTRLPERVVFGPQPAPTDPYRSLAEHYAPFVAQETWFQPKSDYIARFDADGDWDGANNWVNTDVSSSQAYVYYAAIESETHWFLIYSFFHPRDYSDKCVGGTCHENDNEGMILTVAKDGTPFGSAVAMETLAHNKVYSYRADPRVTGRFHNLEGEVEFIDGSHPVVFVHSGGHGVYGSGQHSGYSLAGDRFAGGTGVTYRYTGTAERPRHPADRNVGYDLLPVYDHWWLRSAQAGAGGNDTFSAYYRYRPFGDRPLAAYELISGAFRGVRNGRDMAKPFWGWHDNETVDKRVLAKGQWALDPAYAVSRNLRLPGPFSLRYVHNPYLKSAP